MDVRLVCKGCSKEWVKMLTARGYCIECLVVMDDRYYGLFGRKIPVGRGSWLT